MYRYLAHCDPAHGVNQERKLTKNISRTENYLCF